MGIKELYELQKIQADWHRVRFEKWQSEINTRKKEKNQWLACRECGTQKDIAAYYKSRYADVPRQPCIECMKLKRGSNPFVDNCVLCGAEFSTLSPRRKYCSDKCNKKASRIRAKERRESKGALYEKE